MKTNQLLLCMLFLGIFFVACKEEQEIAKPVEKASFDLIQERILTPSCATAGCHSSEQDRTFNQHGLVLAKGKAYDYLVGKDPKNQNAMDDKLKRVVAYFSLQSLLFHKLTWDTSLHHSGKSYGGLMPLNGKELSKGKVEFVRRWIEAGAPRTGAVVDTALVNN